MDRRSLLKVASGIVSATAFGKIIFQSEIVNASDSSDFAPISFETFQVQFIRLTTDFLANPKTEESFLYAVASLLKRVESFPEMSFGQPIDLGGGAKFSRGVRKNSISFNKLTIDPNGYLKAHDHRFYVGILICLEGSAKCRNFNIIREENGKVLLQKTTEIAMNQGDIALILQGKNNVHDLKTGHQALKSYDIYTFVDEKQAQSKFLEIEEKSWNSEQETYEARWL